MPLVTAVEPTMVKHLGNFTIATFDGKQTALTSALKYTRDHHTDITYLVSPPSKQGEVGFQTVMMRPMVHKLTTDGILVASDQSAAMYSRDCPILFLCDQSRDYGLLLHCGRPAMTPVLSVLESWYNIISVGLSVMRSRGSHPSDLSAYITAGICGKCFTHDAQKDKSLLAPFRRNYGWAVDPETGGLNLIGIIENQLILSRIAADNISHDGLCTKEHPGLASKRGGDTDSNLVVAFIA